MAIRKPSLSVREARHLAIARNAALEQDGPLKPIADAAMARRDAGDELDGPAADALARSGVEAIEPTMQVFLSAPHPADNVSWSFDFLSRKYPPEKALRMILRRALDDYEIALENGSFQAQPQEYSVQADPSRAGIIQTSRIMPVVLLNRARAFFDPLGFESNRAFGRKLALAALAAFFSLEEKRRP